MENASPDDGKSTVAQQRARGDNEFQARSQYLTNSVNSSASRSGNYNGDFAPLVVGGERTSRLPMSRLSRMVPQWIGGELILARRVEPEWT